MGEEEGSVGVVDTGQPGPTMIDAPTLKGTCGVIDACGVTQYYKVDEFGRRLLEECELWRVPSEEESDILAITRDVARS